MSTNSIVQKFWNLCDVLRDDGINYSDYVTDVGLILGGEYNLPLSEGCRWEDINDKNGITLLNDYKRILLSLTTGKDAGGNSIHGDKFIQWRAEKSDLNTGDNSAEALLAKNSARA